MAKKTSKASELDVVPYTDNVDKKYVPEGFESVEEYLKDVREDYELDLQFDHENRLEALDDKKFAAGEQWDPEVLKYRKGLPNLVINQIPQFVAQLVGDWRQNRNSIKVLPAEDSDIDVSEVRADLIRAIEYSSRADRVYDAAFESQTTCGDGAFRVAVEYARESVFDQDIFIRSIDDALSVVWDRMSIDPTGKDARHCFVEDSIPLKEFERKWPGAEPSTLGEGTARGMRSDGWYDDKTAKVLEHWRIIERDRLLGLFSDGAVHFIDDEEKMLEELTMTHGPLVKTRMSPCRYAQMHLVTGWKILAGPYEYKLTRLPIIRMTGRVQNIEGRRVRYGLVRFMKDASRLRNFWRSVAAEQLGYAPKSQWIGPESAFAGREDSFRKAHLSRDPVLIYNDDAIAPPERLDPPAPQMALLNEAQINTQDMKDVTGIHDASLGIKSNETSGRAIMARQREGDVASLTYYDNGNASILEAGDVINQLIETVYDGTRIIRTIGADETPKLQKINDPFNPKSPNLAIGRYDVVLDTGPSYTTKRQEAAQSMMEAVQVYPQLMQIAGDLVAKAQDWPGAQDLAERIKKTIPPQLLSEEEQQAGGGSAAGMNPEIQQQMMEFQAQMQALQQENQQLKSDRSLEAQRLQIDAYDAETRRMKASHDANHDQNSLAVKMVSDAHNAKIAQQKATQSQAKAKSSPKK